MHWALAFLVTQLIEVPIYMKAQHRFGVAFGASAITHPIVWFVFPYLMHGSSYVVTVLCAEAFAIIAEAAWLQRHGVRRPLAWSLVANLTSVTIGFGIRALTGWF